MNPHMLSRSVRVTTLASAVMILGAVLSPSGVLAQGASPTQSSDRARIEEVLNRLNRGQFMGQVAVAPDGKRLAWILRAKAGVEIRVAPLYDLQKSERVTAAAEQEQHCSEGQLAWSPDAKALAFFSDCAKVGEQADLYLTRLDGIPARRLTELNGYVEAPAFSPDGTRVAFLYLKSVARPASALTGMMSSAGDSGGAGSKTEQVAVTAIDATKLAAPVLATPANLYVYEFDWSPDSNGLAYVAADLPGENNWGVAKLYTQTFGGTPKEILAPTAVANPLHGLQIAVPRWSPDGKVIAFIGGAMSERGATGGDVWIIQAAGGQPRNLTAQRPTSPAWVEWESNDHLFVNELAGGNCQLIRFRLQGDRTSPGGQISFGSPIFSIPGSVGDGRLVLSLSATADHSLFVFNASTIDRPWEIFGAKPGTVMTSGLEGVIQLSHQNDGLEPAWGRPVSASWKSDKFRILGWLMLPKDYDSAKKYPLIVELHGGLPSAVAARWGGGGGLNAAVFSALGYFVLQINPRGSFGQGEDFVQANHKDFGDGDLHDILAGVDAVEARYPVDPNRVGLTGWSFGGFKSISAVSLANRFKAAVWGDGIAVRHDFYADSTGDHPITPYCGDSVYDDPAVYAGISPVNFTQHAYAPTVVAPGNRDNGCQTPLSYEFWHALPNQDVPAQPAAHSHEGHDIGNPAGQREVMERAVEWFARYMPPSE